MLNAALVIEPLVICLILFSPLFYAGISFFALSIIEGVSFLLLAIFLIRALLKENISFVKIPLLPLFVFILLIFIQIFPLPRAIFSMASPATESLYVDFRFANTANYTISIYPEAGINMILQFLSYLAVFWVILNYADSMAKVKRLISAIIIAGLAYSLFGIMHGLNKITSQFSTFTNPNHFAAYIEMIIPLALGWSLADVSKTTRFTIIFIAAVQILALFLSLSRAGIICFSISFMIMFLLLRFRNPVKKEWVMVIILGLVLSLFLGITGLRPIAAELRTIIEHKSFDRLYILKDSLRIIKDFPLFGVGLGAFGEIFNKYKSFSSQLNYGFAHNEPLQLLTETGLLGFLSVAVFFFIYFRNIFNVWLKRRNRFALFMGLGIFTGVVSVILHSLFDFVFHIPANAFLLFVVMALSYRVVYAEGKHGPLPLEEYRFSLAPVLKFCCISAVCILLVFFEVLIIKRYQAEAAFDSVKQYKIAKRGTEAVIGYKKAIRGIDKAIVLNSGNSSYLNKKADLFSDIAIKSELANELSNLSEFAYGNTSELLGLAQADYGKAIELNPTKPDYHLKLGWIYGELGKTDLMQREFKIAVLLDPQNAKISEYINKNAGGMAFGQ